ncbi:hypothetical protein ACI8AC_01510 [Geodermatophilus sp. SYSU D00758]
MSKYVLMIVINAPLILIAVLMAVTSYKTRRSTRRRCRILVTFWLSVGVGMLFIEPAYDSLVRANLTDSPPMSLFDIVLLTAIIFLVLLLVQLYERLTTLNRKVSRMHEGIAILEQSRATVDGSVPTP